jgi:shikimate kinase
VNPGRQLVFLIGYRGTGKTSVARLLATALGWGWRDADAVLEEQAGRSIRQIFAEDGETTFRDMEAAVLADLAQLDRQVIATGGGVILRPDNRARLRAGNVVWLSAPAAVLWQRLQHDATTTERRPDLAQGGVEEIEQLLRVRTPLYAASADWTVDTATQSPEEAAAGIYRWLTSVRPSENPS